MATRFTGLGLAFNAEVGGVVETVLPPVYLAPNAAGDGPAEMLILVGDQTGRVIGELDGDLVGAAWKLSDYGQARITIPRSGATATERLLRPGNRILIQFGNGLPDWGGLMDLPRKWKDGRIEVTAYSGERLLVDRITDRGRYFTNATAGEIFRALLTEMSPLGVEIGQVWYGGEMHSPDYHFRGIHDIFTKSLSSRMEQAEWDVTASLSGGRIIFRANYYQQKGTDHGRRLALIEGVNLGDTELNEQGPIVNDWYFAGAGTGWGEDTRIYSHAADTVSQARYGLRQRGDIRVDVSIQATLDNHAATALAESKEPRAVVSPVALDRPPARFGQYGVGDTVWMELYEAGFGGYAAAVRIRAREFLPGRGVCSLVIS